MNRRFPHVRSLYFFPLQFLKKFFFTIGFSVFLQYGPVDHDAPLSSSLEDPGSLCILTTFLRCLWPLSPALPLLERIRPYFNQTPANDFLDLIARALFVFIEVPHEMTLGLVSTLPSNTPNRDSLRSWKFQVMFGKDFHEPKTFFISL